MLLNEIKCSYLVAAVAEILVVGDGVNTPLSPPAQSQRHDGRGTPHPGHGGGRRAPQGSVLYPGHGGGRRAPQGSVLYPGHRGGRRAPQGSVIQRHRDATHVQRVPSGVMTSWVRAHNAMTSSNTYLTMLRSHPMCITQCHNIIQCVLYDIMTSSSMCLTML